MQCTIVTPERTVCDLETDFVALWLFDGEIGIAPDHAPMIGRLGYGELRIGHQPEADRYYVDGGFVEVLENVVTVLTPRAIAAAEIDSDRVREQLRSAQSRRAATPETVAARDRAIAQGRAQLRVARPS